MLTFGSLFAGIGGFERAGLECRWHVASDRRHHGWCDGSALDVRGSVQRGDVMEFEVTVLPWWATIAICLVTVTIGVSIALVIAFVLYRRPRSDRLPKKW